MHKKLVPAADNILPVNVGGDNIFSVSWKAGHIYIELKLLSALVHQQEYDMDSAEEIGYIG